MRHTTLGELLGQTFTLYRRHLWFVLAIAVPIVVIVIGVTAVGLGEIGERYHSSLPARDSTLELVASVLVTVPLITSILARWVMLEIRGERSELTELLASALEAFPWALLVIVVWLVAVLVAGSLLILPGIYLLVSWYFGVQAVVIDGHRGLAPISRSAALVRGNWWRTAGVLLALALISYVPAAVIALAFSSLARSANSEAVVVAGNIVGFVVTLPFQAIATTLYYLDLRQTATAGRR